MRLFIDSSEASEIRELGGRGRAVGVTIRGEAPAALAELCGLVTGPVIVDAGPGDQAALLASARALRDVGANVVVRLPMSVDGIEAVRACVAEGIATSVSVCTTAVQVVMAAKAGARFVETLFGSQGVGDDRDVVRKMIANLKMYGLPTEVVIGPLRNADQIVDAALVGAHIATAPYEVLEGLGGGVPAGTGPGSQAASG